MSAGKHTPGPWIVEEGLTRLRDYRVISEAVPDAHDAWVADSNTLQDAQLIAAAPDLLAFAQSLVHAWRGDGLPYPYLIAKAAEDVIAKATGAAR